MTLLCETCLVDWQERILGRGSERPQGPNPDPLRDPYIFSAITVHLGQALCVEHWRDRAFH